MSSQRSSCSCSGVTPKCAAASSMVTPSWAREPRHEREQPREPGRSGVGAAWSGAHAAPSPPRRRAAGARRRRAATTARAPRALGAEPDELAARAPRRRSRRARARRRRHRRTPRSRAGAARAPGPAATRIRAVRAPGVGRRGGDHARPRRSPRARRSARATRSWSTAPTTRESRNTRAAPRGRVVADEVPVAAARGDAPRLHLARLGRVGRPACGSRSGRPCAVRTASSSDGERRLGRGDPGLDADRTLDHEPCRRRPPRACAARAAPPGRGWPAPRPVRRAPAPRARRCEVAPPAGRSRRAATR